MRLKIGMPANDRALSMEPHSCRYVRWFSVLSPVAWVVWATDRSNQRQHQVGTVIAIMMITTLACAVVFYLRQLFPN